MSADLNVFKDVVEKLTQAKVPYMVTGSIAANFYSQPRMTRDLDVVIQVAPAQAQKIFDLFKDQYYCDLDTINDALQRKGMFNLIHNESVFKVDFIVRKVSAFSDQSFQRKRQLKMGDLECFVISPEDLVISKLLWAKESLSEMQLRDIQKLVESVKDMDRPYIDRWVQALDLTEIYSKVSK